MRHGYSAFRPATSSWRVFVSAGLLVAYVILAGEAIHCQYFSSEHDQHGSSQPQTATHATHCILANHGSAAIPSIASLGLSALPLLRAVVHVDRAVSTTAFVASSQARAPPLV